MKPNYRWWPISFGWRKGFSEDCRYTLWHGWPIGDGSGKYGRTFHFGRFKIYFGRRG